MKVSVSLPEEDLAFLDAYVREQGFESRSAVVQKAVRVLRALDLGDSYEAAWTEWQGSDDAYLWQSTSSDGLEP